MQLHLCKCKIYNNIYTHIIISLEFGRVVARVRPNNNNTVMNHVFQEGC